MRGCNMKLKYSVKGLPYIELDKNNKLVFSTTTATDKGFKWLMFSGISTTTESISAGKGKKKTKKKVTRTAPISTMIDMEFSGMSKQSKNANGYLTKSYLDGMRRMFKPYVNEDGIFLRSNLEKFAKNINNDNVYSKEDFLEDDPMGYYEDDDDDEDIAV